MNDLDTLIEQLEVKTKELFEAWEARGSEYDTYSQIEGLADRISANAHTIADLAFEVRTETEEGVWEE